MDTPTITDWIQAIAAAVGLPGALIVIWLFLRKDKEREKEIESLISIAAQLTKLISISEARYLDVRKPIIEFSVKPNGDNIFDLTMKNVNAQSKLKRFVCEVKEGGEVVNPTGVLESGSVQFMKVDIVLKKNELQLVECKLTYTLSDNTILYQKGLLAIFGKPVQSSFFAMPITSDKD